MEAKLDMVVPEVFPALCGKRVLVMEFALASVMPSVAIIVPKGLNSQVDGHQVAAGDASLAPEERLQVMTSLVRAYAHGLFVSGHFNGDPHVPRRSDLNRDSNMSAWPIRQGISW